MRRYVAKPSSEYDPTPLVQIAPLDRLQVPPILDGQAGSFRVPRERCSIGADNDLEAVRLWLGQYDSNPETFRAYRQAVEQLVNWALVERRKPLSSLDNVDFVAFEQFLTDPQPSWRWISPRSTARSDGNWTPLVGPLSPRSTLHALVIIRVMFDWLRDVGYCDVGRSLWRHAIRSFQQSSALILSVARDTTPEFIRFDDWRLLRRSLDQMGRNGQGLQARLAIELMYYGSLTVKEVAEVRVDDLIARDGALLLEIRSRLAHLSQIYLVPPLVQTIGRALGMARDIPVNMPVADLAQDVITPENSLNFLVSTRHIGKLVKRTIAKSARFAEAEGNLAAADRLLRVTAHHLRHAIEGHAMAIGAVNWLWLLIGAARLAPPVTRQYLPGREKLEASDLEKAFCSLAPCWSDEGDDQRLQSILACAPSDRPSAAE